MVDRDNAQTAGWTVFGVAVCAAVAFAMHGCAEMVTKSNEIDLKTKEVCIKSGGNVFIGNNSAILCIQGNNK